MGEGGETFQETSTWKKMGHNIMMNFRETGWKMDGTSAGLCPIASFGRC
jgi:hypothetical protein